MAAKKQKSAKKTKASKKAVKRGGRPPKGAATKADFVRARLAEGKSAKEIMEAAAAAGMQIRAPQIYKLKAKMGGKTVAKPKTAAGPAGGTVTTAADFIRRHPDDPANVVVELGAKAGLTFSASAVYQTRAYDKKKGAAPKTASKVRARPQAVRTTNGGETAFKKMALEIGFPRARLLVVELERKWNDLLA